MQNYQTTLSFKVYSCIYAANDTIKLINILSFHVYNMVAFVSIGCNTILKCVPWKRGDEILASNFTFGANVNACRNVAEAIKGDEFNPCFS